MTNKTIGWIWVAGQAVVLGSLIIIPGGNAWQRTAPLQAFANVLFFGGLAIIAIAALRLGGALTPTPVPNRNATLSTSGLYKLVRHPIYTGVLLTCAGLVVRSASWLHVAIGVLAIVFFDRKAAWEEQQLRCHFAGYAAYAEQTPKFFPTVGSIRR